MRMLSHYAFVSFCSVMKLLSAVTSRVLFTIPRIVADGICWAIKAVAAKPVLVIGRETWQLIERLFSQKANHQLNIFGRPAKSTGALCSPLLC